MRIIGWVWVCTKCGKKERQQGNVVDSFDKRPCGGAAELTWIDPAFLMKVPFDLEDWDIKMRLSETYEKSASNEFYVISYEDGSGNIELLS